MRITDTHCHLNFGQFDEDRDQIISKALDSGIERLMIPGVDIETSRTAIECAENYTEVYASVGVHPNSGNGWTNRSIEELKKLAAHPKVVAIGEIGLDYYRDNTAKDIQAKIFFQQLELALNLELPVVIHNREATKDMLGMLARWHNKLIEFESSLVERPGVLHSFSGSVEEANEAIELNFLLGISGPVTYKNAEKLREVVKNIELENLLVETDSPYLTPQRFRGQRNEPYYVKFVVNKISEIKQISEEEVAKITSVNAEILFNWK